MSETVHYKGKLIPIQIDVDAEEVARQTLINCGIVPDPDYDSFVEQLDDEVDDAKYFERGGILYKVQSTTLDLDDDIMYAKMNVDGSIDFEVKYYNGGASLDEALNMSIDKITIRMV